MEYYSALQRKEIQTQATTWISLEDIMFIEISQTPKRQLLYDSIYVKSYRRVLETESKMAAGRRWEASV